MIRVRSDGLPIAGSLGPPTPGSFTPGVAVAEGAEAGNAGPGEGRSGATVSLKLSCANFGLEKTAAGIPGVDLISSNFVVVVSVVETVVNAVVEIINLAAGLEVVVTVVVVIVVVVELVVDVVVVVEVAVVYVVVLGVVDVVVSSGVTRPRVGLMVSACKDRLFFNIWPPKNG